MHQTYCVTYDGRDEPGKNTIPTVSDTVGGTVADTVAVSVADSVAVSVAVSVADSVAVSVAVITPGFNLWCPIGDKDLTQCVKHLITKGITVYSNCHPPNQRGLMCQP